MASSLVIFSLTLCLWLVPVFLASDQCVPMKDGPFEGCSISGYNHTFPIPYELSTRSKQRIRQTIKYMTRAARNCSVASIGETMGCAFLAPYCKDGNAVLPCRRVCSEFLKRCAGIFPAFLVDIMVAMCTILPNTTSLATKGKCFEPPDFHKYHNASSEGPLERKCQDIVFPFCKNLGYPHTMITTKRQMRLYKMFYGKNYTDDEAGPSPDSILQKLMYYMGNHSSCSQDIRTMICADIIPPCFKEEGLAFYTVCKDVCLNIGKKCPAFLESDFGYFVYCERMAAGNTTEKSGYCKHTSWPPPMRWLDVYKDRPTPPTKEKGGMGGAVITVIIVVVLIVAGVTIGLVYYCKTRRLTSKGYSRQEDDKTDLVT